MPKLRAAKITGFTVYAAIAASHILHVVFKAFTTVIKTIYTAAKVYV